MHREASNARAEPDAGSTLSDVPNLPRCGQSHMSHCMRRRLGVPPPPGISPRQTALNTLVVKRRHRALDGQLHARPSPEDDVLRATRGDIEGTSRGHDVPIVPTGGGPPPGAAAAPLEGAGRREGP